MHQAKSVMTSIRNIDDLIILKIQEMDCHISKQVTNRITNISQILNILANLYIIYLLQSG